MILPPSGAARVLTVNGGSSGVKFAVYDAGEPPKQVARGVVASTGDLAGVAERLPLHGVTAVGHRIVHGGPEHFDPVWIDAAVLADLRAAVPLDPTHLPTEIGLIEAVARRLPGVRQVACFDTAFHRDLPDRAARLPIPRRYFETGVRRYGFHGLSYRYLMDELGRRDAGLAAGRVVLAHLGSGASLAAVRNGRCVDTTMGFTPAGGLVMSTRSGDLDPGVLVHLARAEGLSADGLDDLVNRRSGLLGLSGTSADMRDLLARRGTDTRASEAVDVFCYQARKWVGAMAAALGGVDALVFSGGVGEHAPEVRAEICDGLAFLGVRIDPEANARNAMVVSAPGGSAVLVLPTDEESVIARTVLELLETPP